MNVEVTKHGIDASSFDWCLKRLSKGFSDAGISVRLEDDDKSVVFVGRFLPRWEGAEEFPFRLKLLKSNCRLELEVLVARHVEEKMRAAVSVLCCCMNASNNDGACIFDPFGGIALLRYGFDSTETFLSTAQIEVEQIFTKAGYRLFDYVVGLKEVLSGKDPCRVWLYDDSEDSDGADNAKPAPTVLFDYPRDEDLIEEEDWDF